MGEVDAFRGMLLVRRHPFLIGLTVLGPAGQDAPKPNSTVGAKETAGLRPIELSLPFSVAIEFGELTEIGGLFSDVFNLSTDSVFDGL